MAYDSASEGEIVESEGDMKAKTTKSRMKDLDINDLDRPRSHASGSNRHLSPEFDHHELGYNGNGHAGHRHNGGSSYANGQSSRGTKRPRPEDHAQDERDPRKFRTYYEDSPGREQHEGQHRSTGKDRGHNAHNSRDGRSDGRYGRGNGHRDRLGQHDEVRHRRTSSSSYESTKSREPAERRDRRQAASRSVPSRGDAMEVESTGKNIPQASTESSNGSAASHEGDDGAEAGAAPMDEAAMLEERRKRRQALREKHSKDPALLQQALTTSSSATMPVEVKEPAETGQVSAPSSPSTPKPDSADSPAAISVGDDAELANDTFFQPSTAAAHDEPSAADYDPAMDMQEDRVKQQAGAQYDSKGQPPIDEEHKPQRKQRAASEEFDMFADDVEIASPEQQSKDRDDDGINGHDAFKGKHLDKGLLDDWDDAEGYYRIIPGELLEKRYEVQTTLGKGVFSAVVRAKDSKTGKPVAIKIIRKQETMFKAGLKEINTLERLAEADMEDKKHMIRLERHFMHKGHLCMVFEHLSINLREVLKKFGRDIGINIKAVRAYAQQIFLGLSLMKKCEVLHADLKPDNILVNENRSQLKIADLGSALQIQDSEVTDVLVSRFYRAPEIMLGIKGDYALDMWSIGCTLFELYTGRICFTGSTNNQMLKTIMECRGKIPNRVLKRAEFWQQHFDADGTFLSVEYDDVSRKEVVRRVNIARSVPAKEIRARVFAGAQNMSVPEAKELNLFADLLDRCLALDPQRRITPNEALRHGFINRAAVASAAVKGK